MSVFAEFHIPTDAFALEFTFEAAPETVIEIERVAATSDLLTPYFWVSEGSFDDFEAAADADSSIENLERIDEFEDSILYRANWTENIESIVYAYTQIGAVILEATGSAEVWELQFRFDDHGRLEQFQEYCVEHGLQFELHRLHDVTNPKTSRQYELTDKQRDALVTAWEAGYYETDADVTLEDVADELGISQQALSNRLRRGYDSLIETTLTVTPPEEDD
ncbi:bacterio-opsin activator [Halorubellus sp. JP-L1]|uniref:helix-turn-helix domain-containing protein n=1 Tax=Halorubellus sp. JP-L1 TaxID=2715753 RepID=UPI00140C986C|nr:helix-turn-helix domain-containing protein [Halorubellus sp. JP-L1]NHN41283.1 bacterio-opsin activator [Halorubellus sp. JP-L1]